MQICRASVDRRSGYIVIRSWLVQVGWFYIFFMLLLFTDLPRIITTSMDKDSLSTPHRLSQSTALL